MINVNKTKEINMNKTNQSETKQQRKHKGAKHRNKTKINFNKVFAKQSEGTAQFYFYIIYIYFL
jgi:hypothetical protein